MNEPRGPIEDRLWPEKLVARVLDASAQPHLHGYDVYGDLAQHYRFSDVVLLALTGEIDIARANAFDVVLTFASPASVAEAPTHAATLAQLCGSRTSGTVAVATTALAEQSRTIVAAHEPVIARLVIGSLNGMAMKYSARSDAEREAVSLLRSRLGAFCACVPALGYDLQLETAIIAVLLACGLRKREQLELALTLARLPMACAEAFAAPVGAFTSYAMNLPPFVYEESAS